MVILMSLLICFLSGVGLPPETEPSHFVHILQPFAEKLGISVNEYIVKYQNAQIQEPELDEFLMHDRAVRESGYVKSDSSSHELG